MSIACEVTSLRRGPASWATARLGGVVSRDNLRHVRAAVTSVLVDEQSVVLDIAGLRLHHPACAGAFSDALAAVGGWPVARLVLVGPQARVRAALTATGVAHEVPVAADVSSGRARLESRPEKVTRRLRLRPEPSAPRRTRAFVAATGSAWNVEQSARQDAAAVATELVTHAMERARSGILTASLDRSGLHIAMRDFNPCRGSKPRTRADLPAARTGPRRVTVGGFRGDSPIRRAGSCGRCSPRSRPPRRHNYRSGGMRT
jgi:hypothetical protein